MNSFKMGNFCFVLFFIFSKTIYVENTNNFKKEIFQSIHV